MISPLGPVFRAIARLFGRIRYEIVIDPTTFQECTTRVERVWRWKSMKFVKVAIHFMGGKFFLRWLD